MKYCKRCETEKLRSEFNNDKSRADGKHPYCKPCKNADGRKRHSLRNKQLVAAKVRDYRARNKVQIAIKSKQYASENATKIADYQRSYREKNKAQLAANKARYNIENKDAVAKKKREYADANLHVCRKSSKNYRFQHPERRRAIVLNYVRNNGAKYAAIAAARRARLLLATPSWADMRQIEQIYAEASRIQKEFSVKIHVDHIVPLRSNLVCGLHVPANLQLLTAFENHSKNNRVWPDMP